MACKSHISVKSFTITSFNFLSYTLVENVLGHVGVYIIYPQ